jgi:hypothetical protein
MAQIICKKCGLTGFSKCPHCRSVFPEHSSPATEIFEFQGFVKKANPEEEAGDDGKRRWLVGMWTYEVSEDAAMRKVLELFKSMLNNPEFSMATASCAHEWDFAEGEKSDIDCGCMATIAK